MADQSLGQTIGPAVALMGAAVVAVPLFRRLGLGSVQGYFAAGLLVGPSALRLLTDPASMLHFSELGVVIFLFVIGLELRPQKLWAMRGQILGLGLSQVACATLALGATAALIFGLSARTAFVAAATLALSSTAVIMSVLQDRDEMSGDAGQQAVAILLFEDLMIVPLLASVAFLSPLSHAAVRWADVLIALASLLVLLAVSRWALNPFFALLAKARTREVLTAGALLVVLGAALLMDAAGMSMAMGAFLAGVMLSNSSYRHQVESDVEPFRGLLMGLFFMAVGMTLDLRIVATEWPLLLTMLLAFMVAKGVTVYAVARFFGSERRRGMERASMFLPGGEFAFVVFTAAAAGGVISAREQALLSTVVILAMALIPILASVAQRLLTTEVSMADVDVAHGLTGRVLIVGFGRFGQITSQTLLSKPVELSVIDNDPERIRDAARFGFKVFFGDGSRLETLRQSGAAGADIILVCVDDSKAALRIVTLARSEFPGAKLLVRSYDRNHSIDLIRAGVDFEIRETVESAYVMGTQSLRELGYAEAEIEEADENARRSDSERLSEQVQGNEMSGRDRLHLSPGS
ncbi:monovalent cation:proton antiporter-2 (CPA2) family protein [Sphingomonas sp. VNH70]|jgi:glutathione-regulated potassium-efflux system protein KefB|uniref:monovalent cation:proton antiporter-2 (CPA2) family protein n=1 Tax=Sphingomonas silueang TaxID=3156617 RepID=UPI0032B6214C